MKLPPPPRRILLNVLIAIVLVAVPLGAQGSPDSDVPLSPTTWKFPDDVAVSWGDYDGDGWPDVFVARPAQLYQNQQGIALPKVADLDEPGGPLLPAAHRYGSSFADYDRDGMPDIAVAPRQNTGDSAFRLLRNLTTSPPAPAFVDVTRTVPAALETWPDLMAETLCWADVDGDGWLDLFVPTYPDWAVPGSRGNLFYHSQGPDAGGFVSFVEMAQAAGLGNPPQGVARKPEGAQFVDVDRDGDLDLDCNGTLYQNVSSAAAPRFQALTDDESGVGHRVKQDEGAAFADYDSDGDMDLFVLYVDVEELGAYCWESRGDGTYFDASAVILQRTGFPTEYGLSCADWDNDGDLDLTTGKIFRQNMFIEGQRTFEKRAFQSSGGLPSWADWDKDGDLDAAIADFFNFSGHDGRLYDNTTYDSSVPESSREFVRIRPALDSTIAPEGLATEFGATARVRLQDDSRTLVRQQFVASSAGYLNQNEYALHFGFEEDPDPQELRFEVSVDFPALPEQGFWRVDPYVNPALGNLNLADLPVATFHREITVLRSGAALINGLALAPEPPVYPVLTTTTGGLVLPGPGSPLSPPAASPQPDWWIGIDFTVSGSVPEIWVKEFFLDGQLDDGVSCGGPAFNVVLWDVTDVQSPVLVLKKTFATSLRNDRSFFPVCVGLAGGRRYRAAARVTSLRGTSTAGRPLDDGVVTVLGGLEYGDSSPCSGEAISQALGDAGTAYVALRYTTDWPSWLDYGNGALGSYGTPVLTGTGSLKRGMPYTLHLTGAKENSPAHLVIGRSVACGPYLGQGPVIVPAEDHVITTLVTDASGELDYSGTWPSNLPRWSSQFFQILVADTVEGGWALSNAISGTTQE